MKRRTTTLFVTLAIALFGATAHAQKAGEWENPPPTQQQGNTGNAGGLRIKCSQGTEGCAQQGEHSCTSGNTGTGTTGAGTTSGGTTNGESQPPNGGTSVPPAAGNTGTGGSAPSNDDPDVRPEQEEAERVAKDAQRALEHSQNPNLDNWQRENAKRILDQRIGRIRYELNRRLNNIEEAKGNDESARVEIRKLRAWYSALTKAGFDEEAAVWYGKNREAIEMLVRLNNEGQLTWLSNNKPAIEKMNSDYKKFSEDGTTLESLKQSFNGLELGAETWVKVCVVIATAISLLLFILKILKK